MEPKRQGSKGKELKCNVTGPESTKMATSKGVMQGYATQAAADCTNQIIIAADVIGPSTRIEFVDHSELSIALQLHAVQMLAYAQEAKLLGVIYFPPLYRTVEEVRASAESFLAAFIGSELVGAASVWPDPEGIGINVASVVVSPQFQRRGIGTALVAAVLAAHGNGEITVQTGVKNLPALSLYARAGFVELRRWWVASEPLELVKLRRPPTGAKNPA